MHSPRFSRVVALVALTIAELTGCALATAPVDAARRHDASDVTAIDDVFAPDPDVIDVGSDAATDSTPADAGLPCTSDANCTTPGATHCDLTSHQCVECRTSADCAAPRPVCGPSTHTCLAGCTIPADCAAASCETCTSGACTSTCTGGRVCDGHGACACPASSPRLCGGSCYAATACCTNADCPSGRTCSGPGGTCGCAAGSRVCGSSCIASASCCTSADCPSGRTCPAPGGTCGCAAGTRLCGSSCLSASQCCTDADCTGLNVCASPGSSCSCRTSPSRQPIYRLVGPGGDHLFSLSSTEGTSVGYSLEGIGYYDYAAPCAWGLVPFHRVSNPGSGEHFYTASQAERDGLVATGWTDEGTIGCVASAAVACGAVPLHRLANPTGFHMFTTSDAERATLVSSGWLNEGEAGWVWGS